MCEQTGSHNTGQIPATGSIIEMCSCSWRTRLGPFTSDMFASQTNLQLLLYYSWKPNPSCCGSRYPLNLLEGSSPIHVPTICPHPSLSDQAPRGEGDSNLNSPSVAQSDLVPTVTQELDRPSDPSPSHTGHCDEPRGPNPPNGNEASPSSGRLACLRRSYCTEGLSDRIISITRKSWRGSTESAYSSAW